MRKNPVYRDSNSRPNVSEGYEVTNWATGATRHRLDYTLLIGCRYFQHAQLIPIVGVGKRGAY